MNAIERHAHHVAERVVHVRGCFERNRHEAELLTVEEPLRQAILAKSDTSALEAAASRSGGATIWSAADDAVAKGMTTLEEIERVLGPKR